VVVLHFERKNNLSPINKEEALQKQYIFIFDVTASELTTAFKIYFDLSKDFIILYLTTL
jgi:hypothetical protein